MEFKKLAVITAGGDAPGMNAAIRSVVRKAAHHQIKMVGIERGYLGLLENNFCELNAKLVGGIGHKSALLKGLNKPVKILKKLKLIA
jgi:6-phosphofructokinase 1